MPSARSTAPAVVAYSSGNHAQGVASAARLLGKAATIVMPADAPAIKLESTRADGAEVRLYDRQRESREAIGAEIAAATGAALVRPYDDPRIIAGQGTVGLELAEQARAPGAIPDAALIPCGGGGLIAGCGLALGRALPGHRDLRRRARRRSTIPAARSPPARGSRTAEGGPLDLRCAAGALPGRAHLRAQPAPARRRSCGRRCGGPARDRLCFPPPQAGRRAGRRGRARRAARGRASTPAAGPSRSCSPAATSIRRCSRRRSVSAPPD